MALVDAHLLGSTAAMLGDWDLQSTLLRRTIQEGARRMPASSGGGEPLLVESADQLAGFQRVLITASRGARTDWASRYLLPPVEDFATEQLMETPVRPLWLVWAALALTLGGAVCFTRGWLGAGPGAAAPLDAARPDCRAARDPAAEAAAGADAVAGSRCGRRPGLRCSRSACGRCATGTGWGALVTAGRRLRLRRSDADREGRDAAGGDLWLFSRRNAIFLAIPFALGGVWTAYLLGAPALCGDCLSSSSSACATHAPVDAKLTQIG